MARSFEAPASHSCGWRFAHVLPLLLVAHALVASSPDPANLVALECSIHQLAFRYGSTRITTNAQALHDALNLGDPACKSVLGSEAIKSNADIIASKPSFTELRRRQQASAKHDSHDDDATSTYYVSTTGRDTNPGTKSAPFATLAGARDAIRKSKPTAAGPAGANEVTVYVRAGKYFLNETFELDHRDSNTAWVAFPGELVTLSGGVQMKASRFKASAANRNILVAEAVGLPTSNRKRAPASAAKFGAPPSRVNQLFQDGQRLVRARYPNGNPQTGAGICFSKAQHAGEGCGAWLKPASNAGGASQDAGNHLYDLKLSLNRGNSPTLGCPECTQGPQQFHYAIYDPPTGHPVYDTDAGGPAVPGWTNRSVFSMWGSIFDRPAAFAVDQETWTNKTWANPERAVVHMFHGALWGGWQFQVAGMDATNASSSSSGGGGGGPTIKLGYGGYQEGRGAHISTGSSHFYVENVFEELDSDGEWYFDEDKQKLYVQPNASSSSSSSPFSSSSSSEFVAPVIDTLVRVGGGAENVSLRGFRLTETRATFMEKYEVPSGGDWSVHRGGAVEVTGGASGATVADNFFDQVGGNGLLLGQGVTGAVVENNEFLYSGDSAIVSVGASDGWDGTDASLYPRGNSVLRNHIHEYGVYGKQTSCYFQALTAESVVADNVCYNGPRAGINFNDGFFGGYNLTGNLLFNHVRETGDHGPFNSWDRQPYFTLNGVDDGFDPGKTSGYPAGIPKGASYLGKQSHISKNFIVNGYNGVWTIDHDDGSQRYNDTANLMVFGGCKNFLGNSKSCDHNTILYPGIDSRSSGGRRCQTDDNGVFANQYFHGNTCFEADGAFYSFSRCTSKNLATTVYETQGNTFYSDGASAAFKSPCSGIGDGLDKWQALGQDAGSTVHPTPPLDQVVQIANATLDW